MKIVFYLFCWFVFLKRKLLLLTGFLDVSQRALTAVGTVSHGGHEDTGTAVRVGALLLGARDLVFFGFTVTFDLVVLEDAEADVDVLVGLLDLLTLDHLLLLLLLLTTINSDGKSNGGLLLDGVFFEEAFVVSEDLGSEDEALVLSGDTFLRFDSVLEGLNSFVGFNVEGDVLAVEGADEELHVCFFKVLSICVEIDVILFSKKEKNV